jgi:hypothetical protein
VLGWNPIGSPAGKRTASVPRGPRGEKRPADVIGAAVMVAKIATGEIEEAHPGGRGPYRKRAA